MLAIQHSNNFHSKMSNNEIKCKTKALESVKKRKAIKININHMTTVLQSYSKFIK